MNPIRISIIIVSYQVREMLLACLDSIRNSAGSREDLEVIVVDNLSSDGSQEAVKANYPNSILIENNFNAGFSGANNQGLAIAKGEYIFLLNPDTELTNGALSGLEAYLENHPSCALVAPRLVNSNGSLQISAWKDSSVMNLLLETFYLHKVFSTHNYPAESFNQEFSPDVVSGAALFFRKSLLGQIGMLDEQLFWMEDVDFCHRARSCGSISYFPDVCVVHHSGQSQKKNYNVSISNQLISKLKYFKKYESSFWSVVANGCCVLFVCSRILAFSASVPFGYLYRQKAKAYLYTFRKLFRYLLLDDKSIV